MNKYVHREATERALVHHQVTFRREGGSWIIDGTGPLSDAQAYAYALGFKAARDRGEKLAALVREFQEHDLRRYGRWTRGMHGRADAALAPWGYDPVPIPLPDHPTHPRTFDDRAEETRCRNHAVAENFCNECGR